MSSKGIRSKTTIRSVDEAIKLIKNGEVILYPTDSVWALGCDANNEEAYERIVSTKGEGHRGRMVLIVDSIQRLKQHVVYIHPRVETLLTYHHKPLTVIYEAQNLPAHVVAEDGTVAIRVTHHAACTQMISAIDAPLIATMASGQNESYALTHEEINTDLLSEYTLLDAQEDGTNKKWNIPSVIATFSAKGELEFVRE